MTSELLLQRSGTVDGICVFIPGVYSNDLFDDLKLCCHWPSMDVLQQNQTIGKLWTGCSVR